MKKHQTHTHVDGRNIHQTRQAHTGDHCPLDGWWAPAGSETDRRYIGRGSLLPAHDGESVPWTLVVATSGSRQPKYALPAPGAFIDAL